MTMKQCRLRVIVLATVAVLMGSVRTYGQWRQYGGPDQAFKSNVKGLALSWPGENGPPRLWSRPLGDGYSAILVEGDRLFTMYRKDKEEIAVCLSSKTGKTVWEYAYESLPPKGHDPEYGNGPNATPLLANGRLFTVGVAGVLHCLDALTGKPLWSHDLLGEFGGNVISYGYSSSPISYGKNVIVLVGGKEHSIVAFDQKTGRVSWRNLSFENSYSTPRILKVAGKDQLVTFMSREVIGVDPNSGQLLWRYPIENKWKQNIALPQLTDDETLFITVLLSGARGLKLVQKEGQFTVDEAWSTRKIQNFFGSAITRGDFAYLSIGRPGATFMAAVNMKTGKPVWRKRGFTRANVLGAGDDNIIILDERGDLAIATATPEEFTVHTRCKLLETPAWTAPTLVGHTLFVRDRHTIMALVLGDTKTQQ